MNDLQLISGVCSVLAALLLISLMVLDESTRRNRLRMSLFGTASALFLFAGVLGLATA